MFIIFLKDFKLVYNDPRRFGFFQIIKNNDLLKKRFVNLGYEPFNLEFNNEYVYSFFKNKKKKIKIKTTIKLTNINLLPSSITARRSVIPNEKISTLSSYSSPFHISGAI